MPNNTVNKIEKLNQEYEDGLFRLVMNDLSEKEGIIFYKENEQLKTNNSPSPESIKRFTKLLDSKLKRDRRSRKFHQPIRALYKFSVAMLIMIVVFSTMMITVQAFRVQVLNFLISIEPQYTSFQLNDTDKNQNDNKLILNWTNTYVPTYIPNDYGANSISYSDSVRKIIFTNHANDSSFIYTEYESNNSIAVDTENASVIESVKINNHDGTLSIKDSTTTLVWQMNDHLFIIQGDLNKNEILKIAKGVQFKK